MHITILVFFGVTERHPGCLNLDDVPASWMKPSQDWEDKHQHRYQRVVFSRPDFHWTAPHLPSSFLSLEHIWIMDGQDMNMEFTSRNKMQACFSVAVKMDADGLISQFGLMFSKVWGCASRFPVPAVVKRKIRVFLPGLWNLP